MPLSAVSLVCRVCVQACLPDNVLFQLDCQGQKMSAQVRRTMHVQGVSHWAPANIGPYSQATVVSKLWYFSHNRYATFIGLLLSFLIFISIYLSSMYMKCALCIYFSLVGK